MSDLSLMALVILAGVIIMPLFSKKIAQMEGKSQDEARSAEEESRKGMVKTFKRYVIWTIIIVMLGILSLVALFLYVLR